MTQAPSTLRRLRACLVLCVVFLRELLLSSWSVATAAFARQPRLAPAVIAMPLRLQSDLAIATLANLVSLTPGTTSLHVSEDQATLYMHCLNAETPEQVIEGIRRAFENPLLEIEG